MMLAHHRRKLYQLTLATVNKADRSNEMLNCKLGKHRIQDHRVWAREFQPPRNLINLIPTKRNKKGNVKSVVKINKPAPTVATATFIENDEVVRMDVENDAFLSETEEGELPQDEEIVEEIYEIPSLVDEQDSAEDTEADDDEDDEVVIRRK